MWDVLAFIALGHRRIGLLNTPDELMFRFITDVRDTRRPLQFASLDLDPELIVDEELTEEGGSAGRAAPTCPEPGPPTAILCGNDIVAMGSDAHLA